MKSVRSTDIPQRGWSHELEIPITQAQLCMDTGLKRVTKGCKVRAVSTEGKNQSALAIHYVAWQGLLQFLTKNLCALVERKIYKKNSFYAGPSLDNAVCDLLIACSVRAMIEQ